MERGAGKEFEHREHTDESCDEATSVLTVGADLAVDVFEELGQRRRRATSSFDCFQNQLTRWQGTPNSTHTRRSSVG
jgi:hypothetical protein